YLMYGTMTVSSLLPSLLLLLLTAYFQRAEAKKSEEVKDSELLAFLCFTQNCQLPVSLLDKGEAVKQMLLYCRAGIGYHLQILPEGTVGGIHRPDPYCEPGVVGIRGVKSGLYLCMTEHGLAYGAEKFTDNCLFKESLEENHYTTYSSLSTPGNYLAISHRGQLRRGNSVGRNQSCAHFLPRII
uniref:Fibroblast growth factor n=1 Tax=Cyprinodon variegatus TaxID=28743 RepID=A0A3Q2FR82_CYPVA